MGDAQTHSNEEDRAFMQRALEEARRGEGLTAPNPMVGCVVVNNDEIVGVGWHKGPGQPHAEADALSEAGARARGATLYVTLEPCNHFGRTPPCSQAVIDAGVAKVVFALADPNPIAAGGAAALQNAGVIVESGLLEAEARHLNRFWLHSLRASRPYVVAKFAVSLDGKIATAGGQSQWITGPVAREHGHRLRQACDAVIVGAGTVITDDPALTVRLDIDAPADPLRVVLDSAGRTSPGAKVYDRAAPGAILAATSAAPSDRLEQFRAHGVDILTVCRDVNGRAHLGEVLEALKLRGATSVMIEGGADVLGAAFDGGYVDEVWAFIAPVVIGGAGAPSPIAGSGPERLADAFRLNNVSMTPCGGDMLIRGEIRNEEPT